MTHVRVSQRPRRYASPTALRLGTPLLAYDLRREAYRLRLVGDRFGPVLRPERRRDAIGDAQRGRRATDRQGSAISPLDGPRGVHQLAFIGAVTLLAVLIGLGVTLILHSSLSRAVAQRGVAGHAVRHHVTSAPVASDSAAFVPPALTTAAHRSHAARAASHHVARHRRPAATTGHHRQAAVTHRSHAPASTSTTATATPSPTTPVQTTSAPTTTSGPVQTSPPPTHTTPAATHTTPAPTHTTSPSTGSSGTSTGGSSGAGTSSSGSSGGSGTVSGGG